MELYSETTLAWSPQLESGEAAMDAHHQEFVDVVNAMLECPDAQFANRLEAFLAHAQEHFASEDRQMEGTDYASAKCHLDEHMAVLASGGQVKERVEAGDIATGRRFARELARWFPEHTTEMDLGLAAWALKQRLGGARVVIHKRS